MDITRKHHLSSRTGYYFLFTGLTSLGGGRTILFQQIFVLDLFLEVWTLFIIFTAYFLKIDTLCFYLECLYKGLIPVGF